MWAIRRAHRRLCRRRPSTQVAIYDDELGFVAPLGPRESELLTNWMGSTDPAELVARGRIFELRREAEP